MYSRTLHLDEEFCFDSPRGLGLIFTARRTERVDLVDEDDAGFMLARHLEQVLHQSVQQQQQ